LLSGEKHLTGAGWSEWMQKMQKKYDYMTYRKDLPGFGEPREGAWDGWMRINFQSKKGGILGVFRQGAAEKSRTVIVDDLQPGKTYTIHLAPNGKQVLKANGQELMEKGFKVEIENQYDAKIFEVRSE
jgi:alpha-galactosidase